MAFKPGEGGRPKGALNKVQSPLTLLKQIQETRPGYDPIVEMLKLEAASVDPDFKAGIHKEVAKYLRPQIKATSMPITGPIDLGTASNPKEMANRLMILMANEQLSLDAGSQLLSALASVSAIESSEEKELLLKTISELEGLSEGVKSKALELRTPAAGNENDLNFI